MLSLLNRLTAIFTNELAIRASPAVFVFSTGDFSVNLKTCIYIDERDGKRRVVAIGAESAINVGARRYEIFSDELWHNDESFAEELLEAFIRYGIHKTQTRVVKMARPIVEIRGCGSLNQTFRDRVTKELVTSAKRAGAISVKIVD